jgi:hypothetical protein
MKEFGLNQGKPCEPYGVTINTGNQPDRLGIVVSEPSAGIIGDIGEGYVKVYEQQPSGAWAVMQVHISRIIGNG